MPTHLTDTDILTGGKVKDSLLNIVDKSFETLTPTSGALAITYSPLRPNKKVTLTANTAITLSGTDGSSSGLFEIVQDGTGSRTLTINGTSVTINPTASAVTLVGWVYDGAAYSFDTNYAVITAAQYADILSRLTALESGLPTLGTPTVTFGTVTTSSIVVNWTSVTNATSYTVKRNTSNTQSGSTTIYTGALLTFTDTGRAAGSTYYYFVIPTAASYNNGAAGSASTSTSSLSTLSTPTLTATVISATQIDLSWTNVANESSYKLEWSANGTTGWTQIGGTIAANTTSYSHTGLTVSTHYYYRVSAIGDGTTYSTSGFGTDDDTTSAGSGGTELLLHNDEIDDAYWAKSNLYVTGNSTNDTTGSPIADTLCPTPDSVTHNFSKLAVTVANSTNYRFSIIAKPATYNNIALDIYNGDYSTLLGSAVFNVSTGTVVSSTAGTPVITSMGSGYYECKINITSNSTAVNLFVNVKNNALDGASFVEADNAKGIVAYRVSLKDI